MLGYAVIGALIAGLYGVVHDQITYSMSPEYFTRLKFFQFRYADFGLACPVLRRGDWLPRDLVGGFHRRLVPRAGRGPRGRTRRSAFPLLPGFCGRSGMCFRRVARGFWPGGVAWSQCSIFLGGRSSPLDAGLWICRASSGLPTSTTRAI